MSRGPAVLAGATLAFACAQDAFADAPRDAGSEEIEIDDTAPAESASSVELTADDLEHRPRTQVSDILRQVPGLMVSQHAGGGKSDQYFIRGFDADHGTDLAIYADGMPVNLPSHAHGQGYADTHFLIPETIDAVLVHKGPYAARFGDFYTAGAMELKTIDQIDGPTLWIAGGESARRIVGMASPRLRDADGDRSLLAVQIADADGPFDHPQDFLQGNALAKWSGRVGAGDLQLEAMWYQARWNASGQLPETAVTSGLVGRFGSLDPSEGGTTARESLQLGYQVHDASGATWRVRAYGLAYRLRLFSNFTIYARDPVNGDEIEQDDDRFTYGVDAAYDKHTSVAGMDTLFTVGAQLRDDDVGTALWHVAKRERLGACFAAGPNPCNRNTDLIRDAALYAEATVHVIPHVHVLPGLRVEQLAWNVDERSAGKAIALPKLSVEIEATPKLDVFANAGSGFHSNDARAAVGAAGEGSLARALGAELGVRTAVLPHARIAADFWYLHLDSELVWDGDEGGTEAAGATRRYGVDLEASYRPVPWLVFDANASFAHAEFVANQGNGNALALAPRVMGQGGITALRGSSFVALRGRGIADRPGNNASTLTAPGYFIFDLIAGTRLGRATANLTVSNLLNAEWREAQFADTVSIARGAPAVEQMCFTPGAPLTATATLAYTF